MTLYTLSVVNIAPEEHYKQVNQVAEIYGCGEDNLSVKLVDASGAVFYGCHSWWTPEDYAMFTDPTLRAQVVPEELWASLATLYERTELDGDPQVNWQKALAELGLNVSRGESGEPTGAN